MSQRTFKNYKSIQQFSSYLHQTSDIPLKYLTVEQQLRQSVEKHPDQLAIASLHQNKEFTYEQFYEKVKQLAASFIGLGLKSQDRIGIYSPNNYQWVLTQFAASMADLILVNINPAYQLKELEYALNKVQCKALVTVEKYKHSNYVEMLKLLAPEIVQNKDETLNSLKLPYLKRLININDNSIEGFINFKDLFDRVGSLQLNELNQIINKISPDSITNIQFTSGTTGSPKGAALSHMNIVNNGFFIADRCKYTFNDKVCISVPLYHCFGMVIGNMACINQASAMIFPSEGFDPKAALQAVTQYRCTSLYGVPTMFIEYINEYERSKNDYDLGSLRTGVIAGSLASEKLMTEIIQTLNIREITNCYGMTETSPVSTQTKPNDDFSIKISTVGQSLPHQEIKIIDENGHIVPRGTPGEYCIRSYSVMQKYWGDVEATNKTIDESGFLRTGDIAIMDKNGYITIVGRIKDMIIRGGENIYPKEIEDYLSNLNGVEQVQVIGCKDQKFGEQVVALIKMKKGFNQIPRKEIYEYCNKQIAHYKIPQYVKYVEDFPLTVTGKPQKNIMRDQINIDLQDPSLVMKYKIK